MGRWLLVRHGETEWSASGRYAGRSDVPLSERGREQARRLRARLAREPVAICYASDLRRAVETAELLLAGRPSDTEVVVCPELRELDFGAWEGRTYAEIAREPDGGAVLRGEIAAPGGETLAQLGGRVARFLERLTRQARAGGTGSVLVVTHGGPLRVLLCLAIGLPPAAHWRFQVDAASISEVAWDDATGARLVRLNDRCHLEGAWRA
jgi:alpha-ribazole phosphatase/probable phosphoglycerate mutase